MITVFTPTYNRSNTLLRLYQSLLQQTDKDFEWIIVDDGSNDNTNEIIKKIISENKLKNPVRCYYQNNSGKHIAINYGVSLAKGQAFFIVDSDDYITNDAIEIIHKYFSAIENNNLFAGISGNKIYKNGNLVGNSFSGEYIDATSLERKKYGIIGDKAEVFKTAVLKKYPFPKFENENFLSEAFIWNKIAFDGYKIRWFNESIYVCEYRDDGLSKNLRKNYRENPLGYLNYVKQEIEFNKIKFPKKNILIGKCINTLKYNSNPKEKIISVFKITLYEYIFSYIIFLLFKKIRLILGKEKTDE